MSAIEAGTVRTARLELLPLRAEHADEMAEVLSDPQLHSFIGGEPANADALRSRYERMLAGPDEEAVSWCNWVVRLSAEDRLTGTVQATIGPSGDRLVAELAWVIGTPWQGRGIAKESGAALVDWLAWRYPVHIVIAHVHPDHHASAAVAAAAGLHRTDQVHDGEIRWQRTLPR